LLLGVLLTGSLVGGIVYLRSPGGNDFIRAGIEQSAAPFLNGTELEIEELRTDLFTFLHFDGISLTDPDDKKLLGIGGLGIGVSLGEPLKRKVDRVSVRIADPSVHLWSLEDGRWNWEALFPPSDDKPSSVWQGTDWLLEEFNLEVLDGAVFLPGFSVHDIALKANASIGRGAVASLDLETFTAELPDIGAVDAAAELQLADGTVGISRLEASVSSIPLRLSGQIKDVFTSPALQLEGGLEIPLAGLRPFVSEPLPGIPLQLEFHLEGGTSDLALTAGLLSDAGSLGLTANADLGSETWSLAVENRGLQLDRIAPEMLEDTWLQGEYTVDATGFSYPEDLEAHFTLSGGKQRVGGEGLRSIDFIGKLSGGTVELERADLELDVAKLYATGKADLLSSTAELQTQVSVPDASRLDVYGVEGLRGSASMEGPLEVSWNGELRVEQRADFLLENIVHELGAVRTAEGDATAMLVGEQITLNAALIMGDFEAAGVEILAVEASIDAQATLDGRVDMTGEVDVTSALVGDGTVELEGLDGAFYFNMDEDGAIIAGTQDMELQKLRLEPAGYVVDGGPIALKLDGSTVSAELLLSRKELTFIDVFASGDLDEGAWIVDRMLFTPVENGSWSATEAVVFEMDSEGNGTVQLVMEGDAGRISLSGGSLDGVPDLLLEVQDFDMNHLASLSHAFMGEEVIDLGLSGTTNLRLSLQGAEGVFQGENKLEIQGLRYPGIMDGIDIQLLLDGKITEPMYSFTARSGGSLLMQLEGTVPVAIEPGIQLDCSEEIQADFVLPASLLSDLHRWFPILPEEDGEVSLSGRVGGKACDPDVELRIAAAVPVGINNERMQLDARLSRSGDRAELVSYFRQGLMQKAELKGAILGGYSDIVQACLGTYDCPTSLPKDALGELDLSFNVNGAQVQDLADLFGLGPYFQGIVLGEFDVHGPLLEPRFNGDFVLQDGVIGDQVLRDVEARLESDGKRVSVDAVANFPPEGSFHLEASLPLATTGSIEADVEAESIPLRLALGLMDGVQVDGGRMDMHATLSGSLSAPQLQLEASISEGALGYEPTGLLYRDLNAAVRATNERVWLDSLEIETKSMYRFIPGQEPGRFQASGELSLDDWLPDIGELRLDFDGFQVSDSPRAVLEISGDMKLSHVHPFSHLEGDLQLDEGIIVVEEDLFLENGTLGLDPSLHIHRKVETKRAQPMDLDFLDNIRADIQVDLSRGVSMRAAVPSMDDYGEAFSSLATVNLDAHLLGEVRVGLYEGVPQLKGEVQTNRGSFDAMGKGFSIDEGSISFVGSDYLNPELRMRAVRRFGRYGDVVVNANGSASAMDLAFSSENGPSDYSQTDILSLILFGKPTSDLAESEGQGGGLLLSAALASIGGTVSRALGGAIVDELDWDPSQGSLRVGKSLGEKLFLTFEKDGTAENDENLNQLTVEWLILNRMYAEFLTGDADVSGAHLYYRWRF
jgi:autotransporter translocation and assembly factor TamB